MASMNRNLNLEEVNSDALFDIPYLNYQTMFQKIIFWGTILACIVGMLVGIFFFDINPNILIFISLLPLIFGILFGCNYNEDLSLIKYLKLIILNPSKLYVFHSTEDLTIIRRKSDEVLREEELRRRRENGSSKEEQKRMLIKLVIGFISFIAILIILLIVINLSKDTEELHHTVSTIQEGNGIYG